MKLALAAALTVMIALPAHAQGMDPVWVGQSAIGQSNMSNARANTRRVAGASESREATSPKSDAADVSSCRSSMTQSRLESVYRGRAMIQGRAKADAWLREECGESAGAIAQSAVRSKATPGQTRTNRQQGSDRKKGCKMVMRPVAGLGGAPMTMGMVPDCD